MKWYIPILMLVGIVTVACSSPSPYAEADRIELAQCLSEQGYIKYGTEWCPHCRTQRELFGDDVFRAHVNYVDCDDQAEVCAIAGVEGYPTWINTQGERLQGTQSLEVLASHSGCELPTISD